MGRRRALGQGARIGQEIVLAMSVLGLTTRQVARLAHVAESTVVRLCAGAGGTQLDTLCAVAIAVGLEVSLRAFPGPGPTLRDSGQLEIATGLRAAADSRWRGVMEMSVGDHGRSADLVFFGIDEIIHVEIERTLIDFQAQYRAAVRKREALAARHERPVRLVLAVEETQRNRTRVDPYMPMVRTTLPATSRQIMRSIRTGAALGADGILWVRRRSLPGQPQGRPRDAPEALR